MYERVLKNKLMHELLPPQKRFVSMVLSVAPLNVRMTLEKDFDSSC